MRLLNLRRAERAVAGGEPGPEGNVTKLIWPSTCQRAADLALELRRARRRGARRASARSSARLSSSARALTIAGGTSEITRNQIGERILGLPRDPLIK